MSAWPPGAALCGIFQRMELSIAPLAETEWPAARALLHRAFVNEPFTREMYGPSSSIGGPDRGVCTPR